MSPAAVGPPGAGAGPPPIPPAAIAAFRALPPELQAIVGRLPVPVAVQLLGLPPREMLAAMARLGGGTGGAGPGGPPPGAPAGIPPQMLPPQAGRMPATPEQLTAQRLARVGLVPARR